MKNRDNHNILVIVFKDGQKSTLSFPYSTQKNDAVRQALSTGEFNEEEIDKFIWMDETSENLSMYGDFFDVEKNEVDFVQHAIGERLKQIRVSRKVIMQKLDIEMIKLMESEESCDGCRKHITDMKKYLRDIPSLIKDYPFTNSNQVLAFNPYDNIFDLIIENPGSGYSTAPTIEIEGPNAHPLRKGFPLKAEAVVENGSIVEVKITSVGSSYLSRPKITVSAPDQEGGEQAVITATLPENNVNLPPLVIE